MSKLCIEKIFIKYGQNEILNDISFETQLDGQLIGLLGPNGAGKSTLFKCITGFERSYIGTITLNQTNLNKLSPSRRTQIGLGYLPQESWLFQEMTVMENLTIYTELLDVKKKEASLLISKALSEMNIESLKNNTAKTLSGGEKRRLEFARTLLLKPTILLLDEPFTGIDPKTIKEIIRIIKDITTSGISVIISDHHAEQILSISDWVHFMYRGSLIESDTPDKIKDSTRIRDIYLGHP